MQVTYSAEVQWRSPKSVLVLFEDSNKVIATVNRIKISALVPGTTYQFRVSAVTESGRGAEVSVIGQTLSSQGNLRCILELLITLLCSYLFQGVWWLISKFEWGPFKVVLTSRQFANLITSVCKL